MLSYSDACERNKSPILEVLRGSFSDRTTVLEIGSGTGQHAVHFSQQLNHLSWHPTERAEFLADLTARVALEGPVNLRAPVVLDVRQAVWPIPRADAIFTANTLHIMSWPEVGALWRGIGALLSAGGITCVYGPFRYDGAYTSNSNREFDLMLRERDPESGIRDIALIQPLAESCGLKLKSDHDLPANNRLLVFEKEPYSLRSDQAPRSGA